MRCLRWTAQRVTSGVLANLKVYDAQLNIAKVEPFRAAGSVLAPGGLEPPR